MVETKWGNFQKPSDFYESPAEQEEDEAIEGVIQEEQPPEEKPQWGDFKTPETYQGEDDPTEDESTFGYLIRNISAHASRLGEQILGRYGNTEKMAKDILSNYPASGGLIGEALSELMGPERWEKLVKGRLGQIAPTSEQLKEFSQEVTEGYTKPKTKGEEHLQNYTETIGSSFSPNRVGNARQVIANNLGIPAASEAVKDTVEGLGFGSDKATYSKLGAWTALSLAANVNASRFASNLMNQGRNGIPNNLNFNIARLQNRLNQVANHPHLLHADPRSQLARQELANIERDLTSGQTSVRSLMTTYDGVNAAKRNRGLFELNRNDQNFARRSIDMVRDAVRDEIMASGANFPEALNNWRSGIQAWAVIHQSRAMTNWIDQLARGPYSKIIGGPAAGLFGVTAYGGLKAPLVALPSAAVIPAGYKTMQTAYRVWQDPNLSGYYWNAISNAQRENIPAFIRDYDKLNKFL
jgi:hypothetical protein